jgi:radical SAM superfamily enzyme YgiQ (UPF0313 family)
MRVLLVNPVRNIVRAPNLSLGYIASALRRKGIDCAIADRAMRGSNEKTLYSVATSGAFDVVGIQVYSCGYKQAQALARAVKAKNPRTVIVFGGRHPSALPEEVLSDEPACDFVIVGEAEEALPELVSRTKAGGSVEDISGVAFRKDGKTVTDGQAGWTRVDDYPLPAWDLIKPQFYPLSPQGVVVKNPPVAPIITSRGCPYSCRFCASSVAGKTVRYRSADAVVDEIGFLHKKFGVGEIQILDDNFTLKRSHAVNILEGILKRGLKVALSLPNGVRLDRLDEELVRLLERAGCYSLTVGLDSGSQRVLDAMERKVSVEEMLEKLHMIKRVSNIRLTGNIIIGLPSETRQDFLKTVSLTLKAPLDRCYFGFYLPLPGSALFDELRSRGKLNGLDYEDLSEMGRSVPFTPDGISQTELRLWLWVAFSAFYMRPSILLGILKEIKGFEHFVFVLSRLYYRLIGVDDR